MNDDKPRKPFPDEETYWVMTTFRGDLVWVETTDKRKVKIRNEEFTKKEYVNVVYRDLNERPAPYRVLPGQFKPIKPRAQMLTLVKP